MPERPRDGGWYFIQSKATHKQLGLPNRSSSGVYKESHIVTRDHGAPWMVQWITYTSEGVPIPGGAEALWISTSSVWPWSTGGDPDEGWGRLDSNHKRQVYGHRPNDGHYQVWDPRPQAGDWWTLQNHATGLRLDGTADDIYTMGPNNGDYQRWGFFPAPAPF